MAGLNFVYITVFTITVVAQGVGKTSGNLAHVETSAMGAHRHVGPTSSVIRREQGSHLKSIANRSKSSEGQTGVGKGDESKRVEVEGEEDEVTSSSAAFSDHLLPPLTAAEDLTSKSQMLLNAIGETLAKVQSHDLQRKAVEDKSMGFCNKNYVAGVIEDGKQYCDADKLMKIIEDPAECKEAAEEFCPDGSCLSTEPKWEIHQDDFSRKNKYPKRCFFTKDEKKWWYNPVGNEPINMTCTDCVPVCEKPEYVENNKSKTCADGYESIIDEDTCRLAARCLNFCAEEHFRVLNGSLEENIAPKGCHVDGMGCVKYNGIEGEPSGEIVGHPVCNLTIQRGGEFLMNATK